MSKLDRSTQSRERERERENARESYLVLTGICKNEPLFDFG